MNPEEIVRLAELIDANPSPLVWSALDESAMLAIVILEETRPREYDWRRIFHAFGGQNWRDTDDGGVNAGNAIRSKLGSPDVGADVRSADVAQALRGLAYIVEESGYDRLRDSWESLQRTIQGAYAGKGIQLAA